jgi:carboxyl-terminal processing protease
MRKSYRNLLLACLAVGVVSFAAGFAARKYGTRSAGSHPLWLASLTGAGIGSAPSDTFSDVLEALEDSYVDRIDDEKPLTYGALRQMMDTLDDPNSRFLDPAETRDLLEAQDGVFHGIGAVVSIVATQEKDGEHRRAVVANVLPNSPAQRAGLRAGDVIVKIGDQWVYEAFPKLHAAARLLPGAKPAAAAEPGKDSEPVVAPDAPQAVTADPDDAFLFSTHDIMQKLSEDGDTVKLAVMGPQRKSLETLEIVAAPTTVTGATALASEPGVGEIRIGGLTKTIGPELDRALESVRAAGAKKLVLDLRGCVGGPTDRAVQVAARFMDGTVGGVERRSGGKNVKLSLAARQTSNAWTGPMAVLVNDQTLGAAELLAGALANRQNTTLVGRHTFGDGLEQSIVPLKDGSSLVMTTGKFTAANGQGYQARGIVPRIAVASAAEQMPAALRELGRTGPAVARSRAAETAR